MNDDFSEIEDMVQHLDASYDVMDGYEQEFMCSMKEHIADERPLSDKQSDFLQETYEKYA